MAGRSRHLAAALTGLGLGLLVVGPGLAPGFVLSYDMVFVPDPSFDRMTFGLTGTVPRHVPSDAFVAALGTVLPGDLVQKLVLLAIFVMACVSAASLVRTERTLPRLVAGVCYAWNPFVAERLLLGHWALLLGYAALPWAVGAASRAAEPGGARRLTRTLLPAAIGGFAAMTLSALTTLPAAALAPGSRRERTKGVARAAVILVALSLPWLVTGWSRPSGMPGYGDAAEAFAARADTPFGAPGSLLLLGGVWNRETVPAGYGAGVTATAWLLVVLLALASYGLWCRTAWSRGLAVAAAAGYACAAVAAVAPGAVGAAIEMWAGFAVLRDGQQYVAPLAVVIAVGLGTAADRAMAARADRAGTALAACALAAPVALLPSLAWGAAGALRPVDYPAGWAAARRIVAADRTPGDVLALPWATYRAYGWNHGRTVLDPLPRYLDRRVILSDAVTIGGGDVDHGRGAAAVTIPAEDPRARALDPHVRGGGPLTPALRAAGVRYVFIDSRSDVRSRLAGASHVMDRPDAVLYRIPDPARAGEPGAPLPPAVAAWLVLAAVTIWSSFSPSITLVPPSDGLLRRRRAR